MKKIVIFVIIFILSFVFIGLNKKQKDARTEVVFWTTQLTPFATYMNDVINSFEQQHPNIKIKWIDVPYAEAEKRVLASLLSNSLPDLINITADFNMTLASKGALAEIDIAQNTYNEALLNTLKYNDKVWGIPFYATSAITIYNKQLLKEFNINTPAKSYDEVFLQMDKAPIIKNKFLLMPTLTENDTLYKILNKYDLSEPDKLTSNKSLELFSQLKNLYNSNKMPKESITQTHREMLEKYSAGQLAYVQIAGNFLNTINENSPDVYSNSDVAYQFYGDTPQYDFSLMTLVVPKKAKYKNEAKMFARYLTNSENQLEFAKITGVLPCNQKTLQNAYFKQDNDSNDLIAKARNIGAKQLNNPISYPIQTKNHKEIIVILNNAIQEILIGEDLKQVLQESAKAWAILINN